MNVTECCCLHGPPTACARNRCCLWYRNSRPLSDLFVLVVKGTVLFAVGLAMHFTESVNGYPFVVGILCGLGLTGIVVGLVLAGCSWYYGTHWGRCFFDCRAGCAYENCPWDSFCPCCWTTEGLKGVSTGEEAHDQVQAHALQEV